jgi:GT2 family glycosyltransferase
MGSNPCLILTHNNLGLTKKCVDSLMRQDTDCWVHVVDNDSTDGTWEWIKGATTAPVQFKPQIGVSAGWNVGLKFLFECEDAEHVLCVNSDTVLPRWFYSSLLSYDGPFISGVSVDNMDVIASHEPRKELAPCPDFSAWLMRRECWDKVGKFDENQVLYCSDLDYHIRAHRAGVRLMNAGVPFYHQRSSTLNNANPKEKRAIQMQADADRLVFYEKYCFHTWSPEYAAQFDESLFGVDAK